jgi:hypothetical protein
MDLNGSMEIIPFRESKLTHLLMPSLSRAGLSGVSMIACVNPQAEDYDETISILGNACVASKIKEFSDIGKLATQTVPREKENPPPAPVQPTTTVASIVAGTTNSILGAKRRRPDSSVATKTLGKKTISASTLPDTNKDNHSNKSSLMNEEEANGSERKRMKKEILSLKQMNEQLVFQNVVKEKEIREEMSHEMMHRSSGLLNKICDLQKQLSTYETRSIGNDLINKSVKKAQQNQLSLENASMTHQLQEAEEEIERIKIEYEYELNRLKYENIRLKEDLQQLKSNNNHGGIKRQLSKQKLTNDENYQVNIGAGIEKGKSPQKSPKSPSRSPLSPLSTNNSPQLNPVANMLRSVSPKKVQLFASNENNLEVKSVPVINNNNNNNNNNNGQLNNKEKNSPQRAKNPFSPANPPNPTSNNAVNASSKAVNGNNNNGTYFTRLRSQLTRI